MLSIIKKIIKKYKLNKKYKKEGSIINSYDVSSDIKLGKRVEIGKKVVICENCKIGDFSYINSEYNYAFIDNNVEIGKFCSIGPNVQIGYGNHNYKYVTTHPILYNEKYIKNLEFDKTEYFKMFEKPTTIGNDVWIGANSNIKKGVTIGDGAVIGMNSIVTKDVPPYAIVVGNPAKIIKYRFEENQIKKLLEIKWWNLPYEEINKEYKTLYDIDTFLNKKAGKRDDEK